MKTPKFAVGEFVVTPFGTGVVTTYDMGGVPLGSIVVSLDGTDTKTVAVCMDRVWSCDK